MPLLGPFSNGIASRISRSLHWPCLIRKIVLWWAIFIFTLFLTGAIMTITSVVVQFFWNSFLRRHADLLLMLLLSAIDHISSIRVLLKSLWICSINLYVCWLLKHRILLLSIHLVCYWLLLDLFWLHLLIGLLLIRPILSIKCMSITSRGIIHILITRWWQWLLLIVVVLLILVHFLDIHKFKLYFY